MTDEPSNVRLLTFDATKVAGLQSKQLVWSSTYCVAEKPMVVTGNH